MRALCLGMGHKKDEKYDWSRANKNAPTIFDYDIVIIDAVVIQKDFNQKKEEFERFFKAGGICFVMLSPAPMKDQEWFFLLKEIEIREVEGKYIICSFEEAKLLFDSFSFTYPCYFIKVPKNSEILAENRVGDPISFVVSYNSGYCFFIPRVKVEDEHKLISFLLENISSLIPEIKKEIPTEVTEIPEWIDEYTTDLERNLLKQKLEIDKKLGKTGKFKPLLYETGSSLKNLIIDALRELGIKVTKLPEECYADIEFPISEELIGVCEVKGLQKNANIRHLRQLFQYFMEQREFENRNVKGIFIVNHFREEKPSERDDPLTKDAWELVKKYDFRVMTTVDLYNFVTQFVEKKVTKEDFLRQFLD